MSEIYLCRSIGGELSHLIPPSWRDCALRQQRDGHEAYIVFSLGMRAILCFQLVTESMERRHCPLNST